MNIEQIETILLKLVEHHDVLRSTFDKGLYIKPVTDFEKIQIGKYEVEEEQLADIFLKIQSSINLKDGPLIRCNIVKTSKGNVLFLCIHHLIIDGFSWRILFDDFNKAAMQLQNNQSINLGTKTNSYLEWANSIKNYIENNNNQLTIQYWKWIINRSHSVQGIEFTDTNGLCEIISNKIVIPSEIVKLYQNIATKFMCNFDEVLLGITKIVLHRMYQVDEIVVCLEEYGRYDDISNFDFGKTIGWFTNMYPIITQCSDDIIECIFSTKHSKADVPAHGLTYLEASKQLGKVKPDIVFNYMGELDSEQKNITLLNTGNDSSPLNDINCKLAINISMIKKELIITLNSNKYAINSVQLELFNKTFLNISEALLDNSLINNQNYSNSAEVDDNSIINGLEF